MNKKLLVVCPTGRDKRELSSRTIMDVYDCVFQSYDDDSVERFICPGAGWMAQSFNPADVIQNLIALCEREGIDGIISSEDYPGSIFASIVANAIGLPGATTQAVLQCQHKYLARRAQQKSVGSATPRFCIVQPQQFVSRDVTVPFPVFVKPVKSFFSVLANKAESIDELTKLVHQSVLPAGFLSQFDWFMREYGMPACDGGALLIEELLSGAQITLEGFVFNGDVTIMGITDSIMYPGTICFKRFEYPSCLSQNVQTRMHTIARDFVTHIGFDNSMFNIEMMYNFDHDTIHIIEMNPRMASQFADLYEKVDGINGYAIAAAIAIGTKPTWQPGLGTHKVACSFVLRTFEDKLLVAQPTANMCDKVQEIFPDVRLQFYGHEGKHLSSVFQDGKSYRYGLVHLGGSSWNDLHYRFDVVMEMLQFRFG